MLVRSLRSKQSLHIRPSKLQLRDLPGVADDDHVIAAAFYSFEDLEPAIQGDMARLRKALHESQDRSEWMTRMESIMLENSNQKVESKPRGQAYPIGPALPTGSHRLAVASTAPASDEPIIAGQEHYHTLIQGISALVGRIMDRYCPDKEKGLIDYMTSRDVSIRFGHHSNVYTTNVQINSSIPIDNHDPDADINALDDLEDSGRLHVDAKDDPCKYSVLLTLSNLPKDHFPGRLYFSSTRTYVDLYPGSILLFKGGMPHCPFTSGPFQGNPDDLAAQNTGLPTLGDGHRQRRLTVINYPTQPATREALTRLRISEGRVRPDIVER